MRTLSLTWQCLTAGKATDVSQRPDREIVTRVTGPDAGYAATPVFIVQAALLLLAKPQLGPAGVHTPAALLGAEEYVERLQRCGITFEELSSNAI